MMFSSSSCVQLAGLRVLDLQYLRQLVVGHGRGGVHLALQQQVHVERLLDQREILVPVEARLGQRGQQLELVAAEPDGHVLALQVGRALDPGVLPRDLAHGAALEDLGDVDQVGALLA